MEKSKKLFTGVVVGKKMEKTSTVVMERTYQHKGVHKTMRAKKTFQVHDPESIASLGDVVQFYEGRPVSKTKYMYLHAVVKKSVNKQDTPLEEVL